MKRVHWLQSADGCCCLPGGVWTYIWWDTWLTEQIRIGSRVLRKVGLHLNSANERPAAVSHWIDVSVSVAVAPLVGFSPDCRRNALSGRLAPQTTYPASPSPPSLPPHTHRDNFCGPWAGNPWFRWISPAAPQLWPTPRQSKRARRCSTSSHTVAEATGH